MFPPTVRAEAQVRRPPTAGLSGGTAQLTARSVPVA